MRTVIVPLTVPPPLLEALRDTRAAVNLLLPDWRAHDPVGIAYGY